MASASFSATILPSVSSGVSASTGASISGSTSASACVTGSTSASVCGGSSVSLSASGSACVSAGTSVIKTMRRRRREAGDEELPIKNVSSEDPGPTISWTKDGSVISTSGDPRIFFGAGNRTLTITNVNRADIGQYRCVAHNSLGNATSNGASLDVQCKYATREFASYFAAEFL